MPEIKVIRDYNGYFENLVSELVKRKKGKFKHKIIEIDIEPCFGFAVDGEIVGDTIRLTFRTAIPGGFIPIPPSDEEAILKKL